MIEHFTRFVEKVAFTEAGCWEWKASKISTGYGQFVSDGHYLAHRWSYTFFVSPIPDGLTIDHLCRNRVCVNPDHLEAVTMKENSLRGYSDPAMNARKTVCKRGHDLDTSRASWIRGRECNICRKQRKMERYYELKAERAKS